MSAPDATRVLAEAAALRETVDRHEREDADAARRAEMSRPIGPELMAAETAAIKRFSPLSRGNKWADVVAFDERAAGLERRQQAVSDDLRVLHERLATAPARDAETLGRWQLAGGQGARPVPETEALEGEVAERQADFEALTAATATVLEQKARFVAKHRKRLRQDADAAVEAAHAEALEAIDRLAEAREKLTTLRSDAIWAALFPSAELATPPTWQLLAGGTVQPAQAALGITSQIDVGRLLDALRQDIGWIKSGASPVQRVALAGRDPRQPPRTAWADSDEYKAERRAEIEAAVAAFRAEWGREPSEDALLAFIAARQTGL